MPRAAIQSRAVSPRSLRPRKPHPVRQTVCRTEVRPSSEQNPIVDPIHPGLSLAPPGRAAFARVLNYTG